MHVALLTVILITTADTLHGPLTVKGSGLHGTPGSAVTYSAGATGGFVGHGEGYGGVYPYGARFFHGALHVKFGPMPQSCYSPRYGCYPGNSRDIQRYPAFHGTFYRRPYNYRNTFDFPWHAALHEPTSHFSYNVGHGDRHEGAHDQPTMQEELPPSVAPAKSHRRRNRVTERRHPNQEQR